MLPGFRRGILGLIGGGIVGASLYLIVRGLVGAVPDALALIGLILYITVVVGGLLLQVRPFDLMSIAVGVGLLFLIVTWLFNGGFGDPSGSLLVFLMFGAAGGWLWGVGSFNPGSSEHEGPRAHALKEQAAETRPPLYRTVYRLTLAFGKWAIPLLRPIIKWLGIALVVSIAIFAIVLFVSANPIVPVARLTTNNADASTAAITGSKVIWFLIFALLVVIGPLVTLAIILALVIPSLSRQVEVSKKMKATGFPSNSPISHLSHYLTRLSDFIVTWISDLLEGLMHSLSK